MKIWTAILWDYRGNTNGASRIKWMGSFATEKEAIKKLLVGVPSMGRLKHTFDILVSHEEYREALRLANIDNEYGTVHEADLTGHVME